MMVKTSARTVLAAATISIAGMLGLLYYAHPSAYTNSHRGVAGEELIMKPRTDLALRTINEMGGGNHSAVNESKTVKPGAQHSSGHTTILVLKESRAITSPYSRTFTSLPQVVIDRVETFVFFIGYARSGHSIIGSMMDAHPNMVIAHEFMLFKKWQSQTTIRSKENLFNALYRDSLVATTRGTRSSKVDCNKGYNLRMERSWQGRFSNLRVIGDKSGGMVGKLYAENPSAVHRSYLELADTVRIPVRVLHVLRNPYDMIATGLLYEASDVHCQKLNASKEKPYNNPTGLLHRANKVFRLARGINRILQEWGLDVLEIHNADHIRDPKGTMQRICDFLDVECPEDYLQQCHDKTFKTLSRSRELVVWSLQARIAVMKGIRKFSFFHRYSFEN